jgi:hypothetical protein
MEAVFWKDSISWHGLARFLQKFGGKQMNEENGRGRKERKMDGWMGDTI